MKNLLVVSLVLCFLCCKEHKDPQIRKIDINTQKPNVDLSSLELDFNNWWAYHYNNISLSSEFLALSDESEIINKTKFLEKLLTGDFIPLKPYNIRQSGQLQTLQTWTHRR